MFLLNFHEKECTKPRNWVPVGLLPVYDESRDKRPGTGYKSTSARKIRLYPQCWTSFLDGWAESLRTKDTVLLTWANGDICLTRLFIGCIMRDQQEGDKYSGGGLVCVINVMQGVRVTLILPALR